MVGFLGDTVPGISINKPIEKNQNLLEILSTCDLVVANIESPLTSFPSVKERGTSLRSDPASVTKVKDLNINVANLANNHIMDSGFPGLTETMSVLTNNEIQCFGAGRDIKQASKPFIFEFSSRKVAFLAYSYKASDVPSTAAVNAPGANPLNLEEAKRMIGTLHENGFIVCTSYHGGNEHFRIPNPKFRTVLREFVKAGANLVVGHHAHIFQGTEIINDSIVAYGLGNFYVEWKKNDIGLKRRGENVGLFLTLEIDQVGAFSIILKNGTVYNHRQEKQSIAAIFSYCSKYRRPFLIQEYLAPHNDVKALMPGPALGTFRLVTYLQKNKNDVTIPYAFMKVPVRGNVTDNFQHGETGNLLCGIDVASGKMLDSRGMWKGEHSILQIKKHPDTKLVFRDFTVPFWGEMQELVARGAKAFPEFKTLGWDVAITDTGIYLIEANCLWDPDGPQITLNRGIKTEIHQLFDS